MKERIPPNERYFFKNITVHRGNLIKELIEDYSEIDLKNVKVSSDVRNR